MDRLKELWLHNFLLIALVALLAILNFFPTDDAQAAGGGWETNGIMALNTQPNERLILIDTNKKNICVYRALGAGQFRLVGARSYLYDVEIEDSANTVIETGNGATYREVRQIWQRTQTGK